MNPPSMNEVVKYAHISRIRYAHHRVGEMAIEGRKETEPMFSRQILMAAGSGVWNRETSGLSAEDLIPLVNGNIESAPDQLMRGAQAADTATQHCYANRHDGDSIAGSIHDSSELRFVRGNFKIHQLAPESPSLPESKADAGRHPNCAGELRCPA